jgi:hypothetical protein
MSSLLTYLTHSQYVNKLSVYDKYEHGLVSLRRIVYELLEMYVHFKIWLLI